jgi:hypothetical protein
MGFLIGVENVMNAVAIWAATEAFSLVILGGRLIASSYCCVPLTIFTSAAQ